MLDFKLKFDNEVLVQVIDGKTGKVREEFAGPNAISDDFLCGGSAGGRIFDTDSGTPFCFLLPDGPNWTGFTWDRTNPWAPYSISTNNSADNGAEPFFAPHPPQNPSVAFLAPDGVTGLPVPTGVPGRWRLNFTWGVPGLPFDFQLRAIGLTDIQNDIVQQLYGIPSIAAQSIFLPLTLVVLPSAVLVHGRDGGAGTPDVLNVSYFLSIVGAS